MVEISVTEEEIESSKCVLSEQVQEIVKGGTIDFEKLLEAVRNDEFFSIESENTAEEEDSYSYYAYENYPDDYREMNDDDFTDKDVGEYDDNSVIS